MEKTPEHLKDVLAELFPDIKFMKHLSSGGGGDVYQVEYQPNSSTLAMKHIQCLATNKESVIKEFNFMMEIKHEFIIDVDRSLSRLTRDQLFVFLELANCDFDQWLKTPEGSNQEKIRLYLFQVASALEYLHLMMFIAHLDIKPKNILITQDDKAKLTDFGISQYFKIENREIKFNLRIGTLLFMAPEQLKVKKSGYRMPPADIYQLGVTFYLAIFRKEPWPKIRLFEDLINKQVEQQKKLRIKLGEFDAELEHLMNAMLSFQSGKRPTIDQILNEKWFESLRGPSSTIATDTHQQSPLSSFRQFFRSSRIFQALSPSKKFYAITQPDSQTVELPVQLSSRLKVMESIGKEKFGNTYLVKSINDNRVLAMKFLSLSNDETIKQRQLFQYRLYCSMLKHQFIIETFGELSALTNENMIIVHELTDSSLFELTSNQTKPLPYEKGHRYSFQLAKALAYLHNELLVAHLNIQPKSIRLINKDDRIKLNDFSCAQVTHSPRQGFEPVLCRYTGGPPNFMAPEQLLTEFRDFDPYEMPPADIYQFGVTIYLIMTGTFPWKTPPLQDNPNQIFLMNHLEQQRNVLQKLNQPNDQLDVGLQYLLKKMMAYESRLRPTIDELLKHQWYISME